LRSHGSLSLNRALLGRRPGAADFDLELLEQTTLDGHIHELVYRPTPLCTPDSLQMRLTW
jgi:hypothetical protein